MDALADNRNSVQKPHPVWNPTGTTAYLNDDDNDNELCTHVIVKWLPKCMYVAENVFLAQ